MKIKRYKSGWIIPCTVAFAKGGMVTNVYASGKSGWSASRAKEEIVEPAQLRISDATILKLFNAKIAKEAVLVVDSTTFESLLR